ncbi:MAG: hypothetical protein SGJ27_15695 [Candidatus Melainabacteria bacterium]|nr:hypothetical protein [Candidatus Melainabacteria bacterium]
MAEGSTTSAMQHSRLLLKHRKRNQVGSGASTAEFAPALVIFFLVVLFPLINLIMFTTGYATGYLCAKQCASRASTQNTYTEALTVVQQEAATFVASGFGAFTKLVPVGGAAGSGIDLYVVSVPYGGGTATSWPKNTPMPAVATPDTNTYEYKVEANFNVGPFMNMSMLPFIGSVPGLGPPARLTFVATGSAEFPEGLNQ